MQFESREVVCRARETQPLVVIWQLVMAPIQQELGSTTPVSHLATCGQSGHVSQPGHALQQGGAGCARDAGEAEALRLPKVGG